MYFNEYYRVRDLEWWCSYYCIVVDVDASNPELVSILVVRLPQAVYRERSIEPALFNQGRSINFLVKAVFMHGPDLVDWALTSSGGV
jgi:hypothetical protein